MIDVSILDQGKVVAVTSETGTRRFHAIWLRDNAPDDTTRAANGQRLITIADIPAQTRIIGAWIGPEDRRLYLDFAPENRHISFDLDWLNIHAYDDTGNQGAMREPGWTPTSVTLWAR